MKRLVLGLIPIVAAIGLAVVCFALLTGAAAADTAASVVKEFDQPDGTTISLRLWGDEFANGWETLDGYTVIQNKATGYWEYAVLDSSGELVPSGVVAGAGSPPSGPHLRPSTAAINAARASEGAPAMGEVYAAAPPAYASGGMNKLFIMVEFPVDPDGVWPAEPATFTAAQMEANLFGGTATGPGDLDDYFREISYGALELSAGPAGVVGPFTVSEDKWEYDEESLDHRDLATEAIQLADATVDFAPYDNDNDGWVDVVAVIWAGGGPDNGCWEGADPDVNHLWPRAFSITPVSVDGGARQVSQCYVVPELLCGTTIRTIGVFAHEFGHKLGLPDLYDTDDTVESAGIGHWGLMGSGSWTSNTPGSENGESPSHMMAWSKWFLGWLTPTDLTGADVGQNIPQVETTPFAVQLLANPGGPDDWPGTGEYFLIENRQRVGFDRGLDGCGLMVWHIDEAMTHNGNEGHTASSHRLVDPEEADGVDPQPNRGDAGDPFPGSSNNMFFNDATMPHSRLYDGTNTDVQMRVVSSGCEANMLVNFGNPSADLAITKVDSPDPVIAGEQLYYYFTVTNNGPAAAGNVEVTDTLPAGVTYVTATVPVVESPPGTLTCSLGAMLVDETRTFTIKVEVDSDLVASSGGPTAITNTATVMSDQPDSDFSNNEASTATVVEDEADLKIVKDIKPDGTVLAGDEAVCTIIIENLGSSTARNVTLTDIYLSDGTFSFGTITTSAGTYDATPNPQVGSGQVTVDCGDLAAGDSVTVKVPFSADEPQDINNHASVSSDTPDPDPSNNQAEDSVSAVALADLEIAKTDVPDPVVAGTSLTYTLTVTNNGPSTAMNVVVRDWLPAEVVIDSLSPSAGSCEAGEPGDAFQPTVWSVGSILAGQYETLIVQVTVLAQTAEGTLLHNDAEVSSAGLDLDNSDNTVTADTTVTTEADLVIEKMDYPDPVVAGEQMTYEVVITNNGNSTARNVSLTEELPPEVSFVSASISDGGTCQVLEIPPFTVECQLDDLDPGESVLVYVVVLVDPSVLHGTVISNTATASSTTYDPDESNNSTTEETTVNAEADLMVEKDINFETGGSSTTIIYYITVTNLGPSDAANVTMVDYLPSVMTKGGKEKVIFVFATEGCVYDEGNHTVTCDIGTLAAGDFAELEIHMQVNGNAGVIKNTVEVTSLTTDPDPSNNVAEKDATVQGGSDRPGGPGGGRGKGPKK